jgi:RNA polymerase sigma-70 factor (ECF subfamily)
MLETIRTDRGVIRKVLRGNPDAFRVLVDRYGGMVHGIACAHVRNAVDAEDITQETFVRLYQWLDRLSSEKSVGAWLVQVARSVAIDWLRKQGRETIRQEGIVDAPSLPNPARDELHRAIWDQLATLGSEQREILVLYYFQSKRRREIARLLGISSEAAAKRLQRARDELGRRLIDALGDDWAAEKRDASRANRVMAVVAASPVAWKPSVSLALSGAAIVGVSATKVTIGIACSAILIAALVYGGWRYMSRPFDTKEITAASTFEFEPTAPKTLESVESRTPGASGAKQEKTASETSERKVVSAASTGLRVYGLLLTEDRQPVAGATVTIDNELDMEMHRRDKEAGGDYTEVEEVKFAAVSDKQGRFDFESVPYLTKRSINDLRLWSRHGGLSVCEPLCPTPASSEQYYELVMTPDGTLTGLVTDTQGVPIKGALVYFCGVQGKKDINELSTTRAYTDKDGRFAFEFLPPGSYKMRISEWGFAAFETPWVAPGDPDLVFRLDTGNTISGRVVEAASGKALPNIGVYACERVAPGAPFEQCRAETNESGQFTVGGLDSGTFFLSVTRTRDKKDVPYALPEPVSVTLQPGVPVTDVELRAILGTTVSGRVVDAATGQPLQGRAWVTGQNADVVTRERTRVATVKEDGSYTLYGFPPGELVLKALDADRTYVIAEKTLTISDATPVTGVDFSLLKLDKNSAKDKMLTGKVIDETGAPVEGANVVAAPGDNRGEGGSALTDAEGEFAISFPYEPPKSVYVQAFLQGAMTRRAGPIAPLGNSCTLRLEPAGRIEGVVVDEAGEPVSGAVVAAIGDEDAGSITRNGAAWRAMAEIRGTKAGTSDTGVFIMPSVIAGSYRIEVYMPAAAMDLPVAKGRAQVRAGETLRTRLVIDTQALGTIEGTVTVNGAPLQDTHVTAMWVRGDAAWMDSVQDYSDSSGRYVLPHVQPGKARVVAEVMPSGQTSADLVQHAQIVEVEAGRTATADFNLDAGKTGAVEGYVYVNGVPTEYANVEFKAANAEEETAGNTNARTNGEGWFRVEGLAEGAYVAEAWQYIPHVASEFRLNEVQEISVKAGETERIDFNLNSGRIEGMVSGIQKGQQAFVSLLDGSGNIFSLTPQVLQSMEERVLVVMSVPQDGPFTFEWIPEGDYVLGAVAVPADATPSSIAPALPAIAAGKFAAAEIQVVGGETVSADLVLP